jgi:hypothetical protein
MAPFAKTVVSIFALLVAIPSSESYSFLRFRESPPPSIPGLSSAFPPDLAETLANAFQSSTHQNPAYASLQIILHSLETKPTCHRAATAALISDCNNLDASSDTPGDLRYRYAAQLAVCEFEATGIWYPDDCKSLDSHKNWHGRCIKRLEERPQWWTTLSNNIQNAMVVCAAVRHEVEQGQCALYVFIIVRPCLRARRQAAGSA